MISVKEFKKTFKISAFKAASTAATDISFEVESGEIHGFLGPNGAGKSTTIKALLNLIRPDSGELVLFGEPVAQGAWRSRLGYMPEHPTFYDYLTGLEMVTWFGQLSGMSRHNAEKEARYQLERVGLGHALKKRVRTYSKGMTQRAGLAQALLGSPELLILDEPMTGLDPIGRKEVRELIVSLRDEGKTVFYSTHILPDIEMTCDRVTIVHQGRTQRSGRLEDILTETTRGITVGLEGLSPGTIDKLRTEHPSLLSTGAEVTFEIESRQTAQTVVAQLLQGEGVRLTRFVPHRDDLETIFVRSLEAAP